MSIPTAPLMRQEIAALDPYVPGKKLEGGIKLSSNENPRGASPLALAAIERATGELNRYPDGGITALRDALASFWSVTPEMVVVGNGSDELFVMTAGAFLRPGDNVITGAHTFSQYGFASTLFGAEVRKSPMPEGHFDLSDVAARVDEKTRIVFLCSPNNPTATIIRRNEMRTLLDALPQSVVVVLDEAYGEFVDDSEYPNSISLVGDYPNLLRFRTFSKIYGLAALRVGYAIGQPELTKAVGRLRQPFNVGTIAQEAARAALDDHEFVATSIEENATGRTRLEAYLSARGVPFIASHANFVCADFSNFGGGAIAVREHLLTDRITVRPLTSFGLPDHLRISVGTAGEMERFYASMDLL